LLSEAYRDQARNETRGIAGPADMTAGRPTRTNDSAQRQEHESARSGQGARIIRMVQCTLFLIAEVTGSVAVRSLSKVRRWSACRAEHPGLHPPDTKPRSDHNLLRAHHSREAPQRSLLGETGRQGSFTLLRQRGRTERRPSQASVQGGASCRIHHRCGQHARPVGGNQHRCVRRVLDSRGGLEKTGLRDVRHRLLFCDF
jgi:hypothetical protein